MLTTAFTEAVGCRVPIQQAPMGVISTPKLAIAVAEAGGLGTISAFGMGAGDLRARLDEMAKATAGALAVNFLTESVDPECVAIAAARVRVVDFFWRRPDPALVDLTHSSGALACWQVGSVEEALAAVDAGCDIVAAQGTEAGGHIRGDTALLPLLASVLDHVDVPVIAAGGIAGPRSLAAVLAAGAAGARVGTRFIATEESGAHPEYIDAVIGAGGDDTEITGGFHICPLCASRPRARVLRSCVDAMRRLPGETAGEIRMGAEAESIPKSSGMPPHKRVSGHVGAMAMYAGQSAGMVSRVTPAREVLEEMSDGAERLLRAGGGLVADLVQNAARPTS